MPHLRLEYAGWGIAENKVFSVLTVRRLHLLPIIIPLVRLCTAIKHSLRSP